MVGFICWGIIGLIIGYSTPIPKKLIEKVFFVFALGPIVWTLVAVSLGPEVWIPFFTCMIIFLMT